MRFMGKKTLSRKISDHLYDHPYQKAFLHHGWGVFVCLLSALVFAFGFRAFIAPANLADLHNSGGLRLVSGGVSGISQTFIALVELISGDAINRNGLYDIVYSCLYFGINVPVFIMAWRGIGKRFALLTLLNVGATSLFTSLLRYADASLFFRISEFVDSNGGLVTRALLGGVCTGISSAIAFKVDASAGGMDVVAYYIALKKSVLVGRYSVLINGVTISAYTLITITDCGWGTDLAAKVFVATLLSVLYLFVTMFVVDTINVRNKKCKIEAVTEMEELGKILIGSLPHGATVVKGTGVFSGHDKYVLTMSVSSYEVKRTVQVIREADPKAFVQVSELKSVYGRFFLPPIR